MSLKTVYHYKDVEIKTTIPIEAKLEATSIDGIVHIKIKDTTSFDLEGKYLKVECYSKNNTIMGTKYIQIDEMNNAKEKEFEVRFNYNRVEKAVIDIVNEKTN